MTDTLHRLEVDLPVTKIRVSRYFVARTLAKAGGSVKSSSGRASGIVRQDSGYEGTASAFSALLKSMEDDGEIKRSLGGKRCYELLLTDDGYMTYQLVEFIGHEDEMPATLVADEPEPEPPPVLLGVPKSRLRRRKTAERLLRDVRAVINDERRGTISHATVDELKANLAAAREETRVQRQRAHVAEEKAREFERQLQKTQKVTHELREALRERERRNLSEIEEIVAVVRSTTGWKVERRSNNHWQFVNPTGEIVSVASSTPSDVRSVKNTRADLRRHGLNV